MIDYTNSSTLYLSQELGSDNNSGFSPVTNNRGEGPVQSFQRVIELLHTMRSNGVLQPITVKIMGVYYLDSPVTPGFEACTRFFGKHHSLRDITFESYGKNRARIIGGKKLTGFQSDRFNGTDCLSLYIPEVKEGTWDFTDLYVNGMRAALTRYPKAGTLQAIATENPTGNLHNGSKWFIAKTEDLDGIDVENASISFCHYWIDEHTPVESYDPETGKLTMALQSRFLITTNYASPVEKDHASDLNYYLENISTTFSEPNTWFLDRKTGILYYIPENPNISPEELEIFAPTQKHLFQFIGTEENKLSGIRLRNLDLFCTRGEYRSRSDSDVSYASDPQSVYNGHGAIQFQYAENCELDHCNILCTGLHGVKIGSGCENIRVKNCRMENLGGGGVVIEGRMASESETLDTRSCQIRDSLIRNIGLRYAAACGILLKNSAHNEICDNEICYTEYTGISAGWVWGYRPSTSNANLIKGNHIHHIGAGKLSDMGGIYLLGPQHGTVVTENHIHDVNSAFYGGWGIYADEGSSYLTVEKNLVYRCKYNCYHQHYGAFNVVRDNIFAFSGHELVAVTRDEAHCGVIFEGNTYITDGNAIYRSITDGAANAYPGGFLPLRAVRNRIWDISGNAPALTRNSSGDIDLQTWQLSYGKDEETVIEKPENIAIDPETRTVTIL